MPVAYGLWLMLIVELFVDLFGASADWYHWP